MKSFLSPTALGSLETTELQSRIEKNLQARLHSHESYSKEEILQVSTNPYRLFPEGYRVNEDEEETLRALISRYRVSIRPPHGMKSHRKIIGPVIVSGKKFLWKVLDFFIRGTLEQMEDFQRILIRSHARQMVELRRLTELAAAHPEVFSASPSKTGEVR